MKRRLRRQPPGNFSAHAGKNEGKVGLDLSRSRLKNHSPLPTTRRRLLAPSFDECACDLLGLGALGALSLLCVRPYHGMYSFMTGVAKRHKVTNVKRKCFHCCSIFCIFNRHHMMNNARQRRLTFCVAVFTDRMFRQVRRA